MIYFYNSLEKIIDIMAIISRTNQHSILDRMNSSELNNSQALAKFLTNFNP